jgi:Leucine-rich repeat (LRR) protein
LLKRISRASRWPNKPAIAVGARAIPGNAKKNRIFFWSSAMRRALFVLIGVLLALPQPMLRARDSKAKTEQAIAAIKKLGGKVELEKQGPKMQVVAVDLKHTKIMDASLEHLKGLTKLQTLFLVDTSVTDDGLVYVKGLTNLEVLELGRTNVTDKGLVHLIGFTRLKSLDLGATQITAKGLEHLKGLTQLETLSLEKARGVNDLGLVQLKGLTNLRTLNLRGTNVSTAGVQELRRALPNLRIIH